VAVAGADWLHPEPEPDPKLQLPPLLDRDVVTLTAAVVDVTVSTSDPQVLVEAALVESPE
jgi:hypothetical protein